MLDSQPRDGKDNRYRNFNIIVILFTLFFNLDKDPESEKKHALITIATGHLSDTKGLVPTHAYAVLGNFIWFF